MTGIRAALAVCALATAGVLTLAQPQAQTPAPASAPPARAKVNPPPGPGYYTDAQAARGKVKFEKECVDCHSVDPKKPPRVSYGGNLASGFRSIAEASYNGHQRYPSVYYYWRRMESEPGDNVDRVSPKDKLDVVAYLLQQNGFPPGPKELIADENAMKAMYLDPGPGFEWLFNGRDLTGWGFLAGHNCEPKPQGCGDTNPFPEVQAKNGEMLVAGKRHTLAYTERLFRNYTLRLEQRYSKRWDDNPDLFPVNGGVMIFMSNIRHWPARYGLVDGRWYDFMHIQGSGPSGASLKNTYDDNVRKLHLRGPNEWQDIEIVAKNGGLKAYLNGVLISTVEDGQLTEPTRLGFQLQVVETHIRHLRVKVDD